MGKLRTLSEENRMRPQDVLFWLKAQPFRPFRITMNSGRTYEIRHSELVVVMTGAIIIVTPSSIEGVADHAEMIGLELIDHIEPLEASVASGGNNAASEN